MGEACSVEAASAARAQSGSGCVTDTERATSSTQRRPHHTEEPLATVHPHAFALRRERRGRKAGQGQAALVSVPKASSSWRSKYRLLRELGHGITATVYQAEALTGLDGNALPAVVSCQHATCGPAVASWSTIGLPAGAPKVPRCLPAALDSCFQAGGRCVAIKRFKKSGSRSLQMELNAMIQVGVHPNLVRLLESYEGNDDDLLVLEYCDGLTLQELIATQKQRIGELLILTTRLIHQLLLAVGHITACGIAHQDVKPENLMLCDLSVEEERALLKLGDFGWAVNLATAKGGVGVFEEGAGSLWYAPAELNPPVEGVESPSPFGAVLGRSDMWSVGVVIYVLLVGRNPFHAAVKLNQQPLVEAEVLRLVALGKFDRTSPRWLALPSDARDFIGSLLQAKPAARPMPDDAVQCSFMVQRLARCQCLAQEPPPWDLQWREQAWTQMSGLQRLGWLAVAQAVSEPELDEDVVARATSSARAGCKGMLRPHTYLFHLARELSSVPPSVWQRRPCRAWPEVLHLAFGYLDIDRDGILSPTDLSCHISKETPKLLDVATAWVANWNSDDPAGLTESDLKAALLSTSAAYASDVEQLDQGLKEDEISSSRLEPRGFYEVESGLPSPGPPELRPETARPDQSKPGQR